MLSDKVLPSIKVIYQCQRAEVWWSHMVITYSSSIHEWWHTRSQMLDMNTFLLRSISRDMNPLALVLKWNKFSKNIPLLIVPRKKIYHQLLNILLLKRKIISSLYTKRTFILFTLKQCTYKTMNEHFKSVMPWVWKRHNTKWIFRCYVFSKSHKNRIK